MCVATVFMKTFGNQLSGKNYHVNEKLGTDVAMIKDGTDIHQEMCVTNFVHENIRGPTSTVNTVKISTLQI